MSSNDRVYDLNAEFALDEFIQHREHVATKPFRFVLSASSVGRRSPWKALAKRLNLMDRASVQQIPSEMQNFVWSQMKEMQKQADELRSSGTEAKSMLESLSNNEKFLKTADAICIAAFVDPQLVQTPEEENVAQRRLHVDRIAAEDRIAFFMACNDADSEVAKRFEAFRDDAGVDVPDRERREIPQPAPVRPVGDAGRGPAIESAV